MGAGEGVKLFTPIFHDDFPQQYNFACRQCQRARFVPPESGAFRKQRGRYGRRVRGG